MNAYTKTPSPPPLKGTHLNAAENHTANSAVLANANTDSPASITLARFLDQVAAALRQSLPPQLWVEATVLAVRASTYGHTLELVDSTLSRRSPASLNAFLPRATLAIIVQDLGLTLDPALLVGLTTVLLIEPGFSPRYGLSARVVGLARSTEVSIRRKQLEQAVATLQHEKLWDRQRRLLAPRDLTRIAVIHPAGSAGWADVGTRLDRWQAAGLVAVRSWPTPFEGEGAAPKLAMTLEAAARSPILGTLPDVIMIVRGGGARAGLTVFDDLAVARAVCLCSVPVVAGVGHAIDRSLVDQVAWRSAATPSLAITLLGSLISETARAAAADHAAIMVAAQRQGAMADHALMAVLQRLAAALQRHGADAAASLAGRWSAARLKATRCCDALHRSGDGLDVLLSGVLAGIPALLERQERHAKALISDSLDRAARSAARHDGKATVLQHIGHTVRTQLDRHIASIGVAQDGIARGAEGRLRDADAALGRMDTIIDGSDIGATLRRGFALLSGPSGDLLWTRAQVLAASRLTITVADGVIAVTDATLAAVPITVAAAV